MMKRSSKIIALIMILLLPVMIFLFLKFFGRNEFSIPVYYAEGVPADTLGCEVESEKPYRVVLSQPVQGNVLLILDGGEELMSNSTRNNLIKRIRENGPAGLDILVFFNKDAGAPLPIEDVFYVPKPREAWGSLRCLFVTSEERQLILLDEQQRIRGYYGTDLEEVDRLLIELDILDLS